MAQIYDMTGKIIEIRPIKKVSKTKLMKGYIKGKLKDPEVIKAIMIGTVAIGVSLFALNKIDAADEIHSRNIAIERFEDTRDHIDNRILSLFIEVALDDMAKDEEHALEYTEIEDIYKYAEKAANISANATDEQFELYKSAKAEATEHYQEAIDKLLDAGYVFGHGDYRYFKNAIVDREGNVLFEISSNKEYGTIYDQKVYGKYTILPDPYSVHSKERYINAREYVDDNMKEETKGFGK